jgi:hypothetical protein
MSAMFKVRVSTQYILQVLFFLLDMFFLLLLFQVCKQYGGVERTLARTRFLFVSIAASHAMLDVFRVFFFPLFFSSFILVAAARYRGLD